jgi:hypothetical protein
MKSSEPVNIRPGPVGIGGKGANQYQGRPFCGNATALGIGVGEGALLGAVTGAAVWWADGTPVTG